MATANSIKIKTEVHTGTRLKELETKAEIFDALVDIIEDKYLGLLMGHTEKEKNISLAKSKKLMR